MLMLFSSLRFTYADIFATLFRFDDTPFFRHFRH